MPFAVHSIADNYIASHANISTITHEEFLALYTQYKAATTKEEQTELQNIIVQSYLRYAIHIAKMYANRGLPLNDLINEATIGLIKALKKYSPDWNTRFTTYSKNWMKHYCRLAIAHQTRTVRLPIYIIRLMYKYGKAKEKLNETLGYTPSHQDVFEYCEFTNKEIEALKLALDKTTDSIDNIHNGNGRKYSDIIPDYRCKEGIDTVQEEEKKTRLDNMIKHLSDKEQKVIIHRKEGETLRDIAEKLGISFQRVAQIEKEAHSKIKKMYN